MFVSEVVWDFPANPNGNSARFISMEYTLDEIEEILMNRRNLASPFAGEQISGPGGVTFGTTSTGKTIGVIWEAECGNPLHVYPIGVIPDPRSP